nr:hypothetical protein CFP56_07171 [Quercus suber]
MTKLNQPSAERSAARAVEDDEQRSATAPGPAKLQIGEQRFRLVSFNRQALRQIRITFFFVTRIKDRRLWRTTNKDRRLPLGEQSFRSASRGSDWRASIGELCFKSESPSSS